MALLPLLAERRALVAAARLAAEHRFDDALAELDGFESPRVDAARISLRTTAVAHYGQGAERAAARHEGRKAQSRLDRAARFVTADLRPRYQAHVRAVRLRQVQSTRAPHLVELVERAETERRRWFGQGPDAPVPALWATESHRPTLLAVARLWSLGTPLPRVHDLLHATSEQLRSARPILARRYPDDLVRGLPRLGEGFVQAVLFVAAGRPDLAALPLAEAADDQPLIAFERARVAHLLDLAPVALDCLVAFAAYARGHRMVGRLHTAVFHAQMALACGQEAQALGLLQQVPDGERGGRPTLMLARLLLDRAEPEAARDLLLPLVHDRPDLPEARHLLDEAVQRLRISL